MFCVVLLTDATVIHFSTKCCCYCCYKMLSISDLWDVLVTGSAFSLKSTLSQLASHTKYSSPVNLHYCTSYTTLLLCFSLNHFTTSWFLMSTMSCSRLSYIATCQCLSAHKIFAYCITAQLHSAFNSATVDVNHSLLMCLQ